jgi:benzoate-CoA ligase family protein
VTETLNIYDHFLGERLTEGRGERTAVLTDQGSHSYRAVARLSARYANLLRERSVFPEDRVLIALPDGVDFVAALFGIIRRGAVVVMINPHLKPHQIRYFYEYSGATAAFVDADLLATFEDAAAESEHAPELIAVGSAAHAEALAAVSDDHPTFPSRSDDAAIWLFSGGTTGHPKAVVQSHGSFVNTCELYGHGILGISPEDITLSVPKLFFGYATGTNLLFPFSVGATSALFPERCTPETLFEKIEAFRPTVLVNVPTMVNNMVGHGAAADCDLSSLRLATSAGEALPTELHSRWDALCGAPLLDGLGTAEMWHVFISNRPDDVRPGTLGKVVPGFEVKVCDEDGAQLGADEIGYLWVRGNSLANGYWQQPAKTREAFRGEWYVSGDMISIDGDGYVTYCGRADDMLKVSGKWLSPKELENCLLGHDAVAEVAVVGVPSTDGLIKPQAFIRVTDGHLGNDALVAELQAWSKERLEPYKYPRAITFHDDLPRTHLGKVDRGKLAREAVP